MPKRRAGEPFHRHRKDRQVKNGRKLYELRILETADGRDRFSRGGQSRSSALRGIPAAKRTGRGPGRRCGILLLPRLGHEAGGAPAGGSLPGERRESLHPVAAVPAGGRCARQGAVPPERCAGTGVLGYLRGPEVQGAGVQSGAGRVGELCLFLVSYLLLWGHCKAGPAGV